MTRDATADDLRRQADAARGLVASLRADGHGDDEALLTDMVEGETGLLEAIAAAIAECDECDIMEAGIKNKQSELSARLKRATDRRERVRGLIEQAMLIADMRSIKLPTATLTVKDIAPKRIITDEAEIPAKFWKQPDPVIDRKALSDADGEIAGTTFTNGTTSLQIRRK